MAEAKRRLMSWPEYLAWEATQPVKYELVDGEVRAMTGGTRQHDTICNNLRAALHERLRGNRCRVQGPDLKVQTGTGNGRYPDALIDCGKGGADTLQAQEPMVVFEVLSRSTSWTDQNAKFDDYDETPTIRHYILIFQDQMCAMVYSRGDKGSFDRRRATVLRDPGESFLIPSLDLSLPLAALYEDVDLEAGQP